LTLVASRDAQVFARHDVRAPAEAAGEFRVNPLYAAAADGENVRLTLSFPSRDYEEEYAACRRYLPEQALVAGAVLDLLPARSLPAALAPLARQRLIVDLPERYC
jgi:hypothetical protein